jgi:glycosyltransferase involved in cell wall biosynthesis
MFSPFLSWQTAGKPNSEEAYIERTVAAAKEVADELVAAGSIADYEIIVVDDASTDNTPKLADELAAADRHARRSGEVS